MSVSLETTVLSPSALDPAAAVQARAFFDDPAMQFWLPDDEERRQRLPWIMRVGVNVGLRFGHVHTTALTMLGHAVWLPPPAAHLSDERLAEAGFADPERHMGEAPLARFRTFMEQVGTAHQRLVPGAHWYLLILGVDPPYQGRGVGSTLIRATLSRVDAERLPCYLETAKERNVAFYRRHGFEVAEEQVIAGVGPRVWLMVRDARK